MKQYKPFLLECIQFLVENRVKTLKEQNPELSDTIDRYAEADNSKTKKFVPWLVSQHKKGNVTPDHPDLESTVRNFDRYKARHGITDHSKHDFQFVAGKVGEHLGKAATRKEQELEQKIEGVEQIHKGSDGIEAFHIKTKEASQLLYGGGDQRGPDDPDKPHGFRGTSWCTAARSEHNLFEKLYGKKYTVHIPDDPRSPYAVHPGMKIVTSRFNDGDKDYDNMLLPEKIRPILNKIDDHYIKNMSERDRAKKRIEDSEETAKDIDTLIDTHHEDDDEATFKIYESTHFGQQHADKIADGVIAGKFQSEHISNVLMSGKLSDGKRDELRNHVFRKYKDQSIQDELQREMPLKRFIRFDHSHVDNLRKMKEHGISLFSGSKWNKLHEHMMEGIRTSDMEPDESNEVFGHMIDLSLSENSVQGHEKQALFRDMLQTGKLHESNVAKIANHAITEAPDQIENLHKWMGYHGGARGKRLSNQFLLDHYHALGKLPNPAKSRETMVELGNPDAPHKEQFLNDHLGDVEPQNFLKIMNKFKELPSAHRKPILDRAVNMIGLGPFHTGGFDMSTFLSQHAQHLDTNHIHGIVKNMDVGVIRKYGLAKFASKVASSPAFTQEHADAARASMKKGNSAFAAHSKYGTLDDAVNYLDENPDEDHVETLEASLNPHMLKSIVLNHGKGQNPITSYFTRGIMATNAWHNMPGSDIDEVIDRVKQKPEQYRRNANTNLMNDLHAAPNFTAEHAKRIIRDPELSETMLMSTAIPNKLTTDEDISELASGKLGQDQSIYALWHPGAKHHHIDQWLANSPNRNKVKADMLGAIKNINKNHEHLKDYDYDGKIAQLTSDVNT